MSHKQRLGLMAAGVLLLLAAPQAVRAADCIKMIGSENGVPNLTMDPAFMNNDDDSYQMFAVYNRFLDLDSKLQPVPELAKSWSVSPDGKVWTFKLEEGVKFHNGKDFTAADVVYTFRRLIDPAVGSPAKGVLGFIKPDNIKAVDAHTVTFTTDQPTADLPTILGVKYNLIVPEGSKSDELKLHEQGTGPFVQDKYSPTETLRIFKRNPTYWRKGLPKAECLQLSVISEEVTRTAAIKSGAADLLISAGPSSLAQLKDDPSVKVLQSAPGGYYTISMWTDTKPFNDVRVRQAMKAVIDRQALVDAVLLGYGLPGNDAPLPPTSPAAYRTDVKPRDVALAKKLLAEAGYPNGIEIELNTGDAAPGFVNFSQAYQQMAAEAGIKVDIVNNPGDSYWDVIWMKKPLFQSFWSARPPAEALGYTFTSAAAYNEGRWKNAKFDGLLDQARSEMDATKRNDLYKQAEQLLADDGGIIIPFFLTNVAVLRAECSGYEPNPQSVNLSYDELTCKGKEAQQ